jgi:hypothetical protein
MGEFVIDKFTVSLRGVYIVNITERLEVYTGYYVYTVNIAGVQEASTWRSLKAQWDCMQNVRGRLRSI